MLFDTSIIIELFKGNPTIIDKFKNETSITIPYIVLGELYLGAYRSSNSIKHIRQIDHFLLNCDVLIADATTAIHYAKVKTSLLLKGKPIPENDIWIAAMAIQSGLSLVTQDKHFKEVNDLDTIYW